MTSHCFIHKCDWFDHVDNLFDHMEQNHRDHIREVSATNMLEFNINEFMSGSRNEKPLLLSTEEHGLYWFLRTRKSTDELLVGLYHVGDSDNISYTLRLGQRSAGMVMYCGGFKTQSDAILNECRNDIYPISIFTHEIDNFTRNNISTVNLILHVEDEWIDTEQFPYTQHSVDWCEEAIDLNKQIIETLFCVICYEDLRNKSIISCENKHHMCDDCMKLLMEKEKTVKCPCCREIIRYDARNYKLEQLTSILKWPGDDEKLMDCANGAEPCHIPEGVHVFAITDSVVENGCFELDIADVF